MPRRKNPKPTVVVHLTESLSAGLIDADLVPVVLDETCTTFHGMYAVVDGRPLLFSAGAIYLAAGQPALISCAKAERRLCIQTIERLNRWITLAESLPPDPAAS